MKCPKCRYLSFEPALRCKHCGYDFSLAEPHPPARTFDELEQQDPDLPMIDLQLRATEAPPPLLPLPSSSLPPSPSLPLQPSPSSRSAARPRPDVAPGIRRGTAAAVALVDRDSPNPGRPAPAPTPLAARRVPVASPTPTPTDLPLFIKRNPAPAPARDQERAAGPIDAGADAPDEPAVQVPAAPRPLVVRRRAPDSGRPASPVVAAAEPALAVNRADRDLLEYLRRVETEAAPAVLPVGPSAPADGVPALMRLQAAAIDVGLLAAMNLAVVWMTLRACDLGVAQLARVPLVPLASFLAGLTVTYVLVFTVLGGQTIGKMVLGLRVVGDSAGEGEDAGTTTARHVSARALLSLVSVLALGLGYLPALLGRRGLAVHDRLTHTRVVRV